MHKTVITSFTEQGYQVYGKAFIESFKKYWPKDVKLVVYYEGDNLRDDWHFIEEVEGLQDWMEAISKFPMMKGDLGDGTYEINLDAGMVRKSFMQAHACKVYGGKVFWIDADVITHSHVPEHFLDTMLPDNKFCCYLGRDEWEFPKYTESGFLGFNTEHPLFPNFFGAYLAVFKSGMIFTLEGWHDCYGFDAARLAFKNFDGEFINLAAHLVPDSTMHPFVNSELGKYMDHRKGNRKTSRTKKEELVVERPEPYWNEEKKTDVVIGNAAEAWAT